MSQQPASSNSADAPELVQVEHLKEPSISKLLDKAKVVYSAGFFITACAAAIEACADHCLQHNKTYALVCSPSHGSKPKWKGSFFVHSCSCKCCVQRNVVARYDALEVILGCPFSVPL
jgi:hypothetical protein